MSDQTSSCLFSKIHNFQTIYLKDFVRLPQDLYMMRWSDAPFCNMLEVNIFAFIQKNNLPQLPAAPQLFDVKPLTLFKKIIYHSCPQLPTAPQLIEVNLYS